MSSGIIRPEMRDAFHGCLELEEQGGLFGWLDLIYKQTEPFQEEVGIHPTESEHWWRSVHQPWSNTLAAQYRVVGKS